MPYRSNQERSMFTHTNYKFSTGQANRKTTLYFSNSIDGGRIKRSSSSGGAGGKIIYQRNCQRVFMNFHESLRIQGQSEDQVAVDVAAKMKKVYNMLTTGKADSRTKLLYSLEPKVGWRVFEFFGDNMCHGSQGAIVPFDADATQVKILLMVNDENME